ncbi:MAG TPA: molybdate ABC transporter substrate-binding protein [Candidatus Aquilonibacter sp.]|nr:molybdate ABC transporter substrate-binding protein [Candidatus Aquilonibacter sp.]
MRRVAASLLLLIAIVVTAPRFAVSAAAKDPDLTISAAVSLKDALDAVTPLFEKVQPSIAVHYNLGASGTLQEQIEQGAPVDVYISASPDQMNALEKQGMLLPGTRRDLLRNTIVLIVPRGSTGISDFNDLLKPEVKIVAIGEPRVVPAGRYAQEVLTHFGLYDSLRPKFVFAKDVRQVLTYVASGNAEAGIVYATDAKTTGEVTVVATAPQDSHAPVVYPVAILKGTKQAAAAKQFEEFLQTPAAQGVFERYGFSSAR